MQVHDRHVELDSIRCIVDQRICVFNLIAFVISFHRKTIVSKHGEKIELLELFLCDNTSSNFAFKIWKQQAIRLAQTIDNGCIVFLHNCKLSVGRRVGSGHEVCGTVDRESAIHVITKRLNDGCGLATHNQEWEVYEEIKAYPTLYKRVMTLREWIACEKPEVLHVDSHRQLSITTADTIRSTMDTTQVPSVLHQCPPSAVDRGGDATVLNVSWTNLQTLLAAPSEHSDPVCLRTRVALKSLRYFGKEASGVASTAAELAHLFYAREVVFLPEETETEGISAGPAGATTKKRSPLPATEPPPPPQPFWDVLYRDMCFVLGAPKGTEKASEAVDSNVVVSASGSNSVDPTQPNAVSSTPLVPFTPRSFVYSLSMSGSLANSPDQGCAMSASKTGDTICAVADNESVCRLLGQVPASVLSHSLQLEHTRRADSSRGTKRKAETALDSGTLHGASETDQYFNYAQSVRGLLESLEQCVVHGEELEVLLLLSPLAQKETDLQRWKEDSVDTKRDVHADFYSQPTTSYCCPDLSVNDTAGSKWWHVQLLHIYV
jgi:hypothetical protein